MSATPEPVAVEETEVVARVRAAQDAVEVPATLDPDALAHRAVRRVRVRRTALAAGGSTAVVGVLAAAVALLPGVLPRGSDLALTVPPAQSAAPAPVEPTADPVPDPTTEQPEQPLRYLPVGDGELPELPGVEHGIAETHHSDYTMQGGLTYTLPPGGWEVDGEAFGEPASVTWMSPEGWNAPGSDTPADAVPPPMNDSGAVLTIDVDPGAASWTAPARDSGAWTVEIPGADFVAVTRGPSDDPGLARWEAHVRHGGTGTGWTVVLEFTDDEVGDELARAFLGNLWFEPDGAPEWFSPTYTYPEVGIVVPGVPAGWQPVSTEDLGYAVPPGWTSRDVEGNFGPGVEWSGPPVDGAPSDVRWNMFVQVGGRGTSSFSTAADQFHPQTIVVPGADFAQVLTSQGPHWVVDTVPALSADVQLHGEDGGPDVLVSITLPGDEAGLETLRGVLGSLQF